MPSWERLTASLNGLIAEIFSCTTLQLIAEWEETLGILDECTGPLGDHAGNPALKFSARGGQSKAYFISLAEQLGYEITITEFAPFRVGINRIGDPLSGEGWAHTWQIAASGSLQYFRADQSKIGERLVTWGSRLFECTMEQIAPAHTILLFGYSG